MADGSKGMLCDYGSSAENSADESPKTQKNCSSPLTKASSKNASASSSESSTFKTQKTLHRTEDKIPRQYRDCSRKSNSRERFSLHRPKYADGGNDKPKNTRGESHIRHHRCQGRSSHYHNRRRSIRSRSHSHRRHRHSHQRHRIRESGHRSSSSSSSSDKRSRHRREDGSPKHKDPGFTRRIVGSTSELARAQEAVKPVDPVAARLSAANKATAIMASAIKPGMNGGLHQLGGTPQDVLARIQETQMADVRAKAEAAATAANLPKFYNPLSVNAAKLAEQQLKRKLLWSKKNDSTVASKEEAKSTMWKTTSMVAGKGDTAAAAKFRKLMGIHDSGAGGDDDGGASGSSFAVDADAMKKAQAQACLFQQLEQEYEMSRTLTHTQRGVGLGYSSAVGSDYYAAYAAMKTDDQQGQGK